MAVAEIPSRVQLEGMTNSQLLRVYFRLHGRMNKDGFQDPLPNDTASSACHFALLFLSTNKRGLEMLFRMHDKFINREVDGFGKPISKHS